MARFGSLDPDEKPKPPPEEPPPSYPQQRRQAVQEAREELAAAPSPEDFSSYPPLETVPAERFSTGQEAASEALEDQQQRRLQKSIVDKVKSQGIRAVESIGIPLGMAMQPQQTVDMAPDPITGRQTAREAGTLANQEMAAHRSKIKGRESLLQDKDFKKAREPYDKAIKQFRKMEDMSKKKGFSALKTGSLPYRFRGWDPPSVVDTAWESIGTARREMEATRKAIAVSPAYKKWAKAMVGAMDKSQELKNLSAMASDLMTGVSKAAGGISGGMALFGIVTGGLMVGHEVLKELGDADDTAIPKTLRFIAQNQEAPLYDYHVAPEAAAQLTPQDIEELYQDGTLSHEFYTQLKGR